MHVVVVSGTDGGGAASWYMARRPGACRKRHDRQHCPDGEADRSHRGQTTVPGIRFLWSARLWGRFDTLAWPSSLSRGPLPRLRRRVEIQVQPSPWDLAEAD